jgi:virginiamycin B lyase
MFKLFAVVLALPVLLSSGDSPADPGLEAAAQETTWPEDPASAASLALEITEWDVPWPDTRPRDPYMSPDGRVWFVGQVGNYLAYLEPDTGEFTRFELPEGARPHNVIVDPDGVPWYAGNGDRHIGRLDPATGEVTRYDMPEGVEDPHTLVWDSEGRIWFTAQRSAKIGHFDPATGDVRTVDVPGEGPRPYGIVVDSGDRPWIAMMGTNAIGTVDPATMELTLHRTPTEESRIRRIAVTSDDRVWWVDAARGQFGLYDPDGGGMSQWESPGGTRSGLYAMASDDRDRLWYVEASLRPNRFVGFDPDVEDFISVTDVPSGGGAVRHMVFHQGTNAIWFGTDAHTIGRAVVP